MLVIAELAFVRLFSNITSYVLDDLFASQCVALFNLYLRNFQHEKCKKKNQKVWVFGYQWNNNTMVTSECSDFIKIFL